MYTEFFISYGYREIFFLWLHARITQSRSSGTCIGMEAAAVYKAILALPASNGFIPFTPSLDIILGWFIQDLIYQLEYPNSWLENYNSIW